MSKSLTLHTCPQCQESLRISSLSCDGCGIEIKARFQDNEFSKLSEEELHLLRLFVNSEGRIKDMEAPLGLSYPTIRQKISDLNQRIQTLRGEISASPQPPFPAPKSEKPTEAAIIQQLKEGRLNFEDAMTAIKKLKKDKN